MSSIFYINIRMYLCQKTNPICTFVFFNVCEWERLEMEQRARSMLGKRKYNQGTGIEWTDLPKGCPDRVFFEGQPLVRSLVPWTNHSFHQILNQFRTIRQEALVLDTAPYKKTKKWFLVQLSQTDAVADPSTWAWKLCALVALLDLLRTKTCCIRILRSMGCRLLEICAVSHAQGAFEKLRQPILKYVQGLDPMFHYLQHVMGDNTVLATLAIGGVYRASMRRRTAFMVQAMDGTRTHAEFKRLQQKDECLLSFLRYLAHAHRDELTATQSLSDFYERPTCENWMAMESCSGITPRILDGAFCYLYRIATVGWQSDWADSARLASHCIKQFAHRDSTEECCRICFQHLSRSSNMYMVFPCACKAPVHQHCLERWNATRHHPSSCCEVCTSRYTFPAKRVSAASCVAMELMQMCKTHLTRNSEGEKNII